MINKMQLKQVRGFPNYFVNPNGEVYAKKSVKSNKLIKLKPTVTPRGYLFHSLRDSNHKQSNIRVHRLVATAFIPNANNLSDLHHIDEDKTNNNVDNLMWISHLQNMRAGTQIQRRSKPVVLTNIKTGEKLYFKSGMDARRAGYGVDKVMSDKYNQKTTKGYTVEWDNPDKYL